MGKIQDLSIHDLVTVLANCEGVKPTLPLTAGPCRPHKGIPEHSFDVLLPSKSFGEKNI